MNQLTNENRALRKLMILW